MLSLATPVAPGPLAARALPPPDGDAGPDFALALDQASTDLREAKPGDATELELTRTPAGTAARGASPHKVDAVESLIEAQTDTSVVGVAPTPDEPLAAPPTRADDSSVPQPPAEDDAPPPELLAWLASLPLPPPAHAPAVVGAKATPARKIDAPSPRSPPPTDSGPPRVDAGARLQALAAPVRPAGDNALPIPALPGSMGGPLPRPPEVGTPLQAELRAEVGTKEFAPALASRLSVLVRDGIEHAQLKLNPAEMGPIEVRIRIDGQQAQVDFSAAQAHTRQALQDAVPALASALRESGLTLTGGGVFEQPRDSRGEARPDPSHGAAARRDTPADTHPGAAPAPRMPRARGVVDLYA